VIVRPPGAPAVPGESRVQSGPRFEPIAGQDAATVAELRAAPAPREPELADGTTPAADEQSLNSHAYVRIGDGYIGRGDARAWALQQGQRIGADKVLIYPMNADGTTRSAFYVRYRLPFGATFRTATAEEQKALGSGGVQLGEIVRGTPASEANLLRGDFVVKFDGRPVADRAAFEQLLREHMGKRVTLTLSRNGVVMNRLVRLGAAAKAQPEPKT
jgi:membrane-associated protease RseP (regulator of RpoE activity)